MKSFYGNYSSSNKRQQTFSRYHKFMECSRDWWRMLSARVTVNIAKEKSFFRALMKKLIINYGENIKVLEDSRQKYPLLLHEETILRFHSRQNGN